MKAEILVLSLLRSCRCFGLVAASVLSLLVSTPAEAVDISTPIPDYKVLVGGSTPTTHLGNHFSSDDTLTYAVTSVLISGTQAIPSFNSARTQLYLPNPASEIGQTRVTVTATATADDGTSTTISDTFDFTVFANNGNQPAVSMGSLPSVPLRDGGASHVFSVSGNFADGDNGDGTPGTDPLTYTISSSDPGVATATVDATGQVIVTSGATGTSGATTITVRATDGILRGSGDTVPRAPDVSLDFTVTVTPPLVLTATGDQTYTVDMAIDTLTLPAATGGASPYSYTLTGPNSGNLPAGLSFNAGSRQPTGTPTTVATTTLTYTATDTNGLTATQTFDVIVNPLVPIISASVSSLTATVGIAIADVTIAPSSSGGPVVSYAISPAIDNGLAFADDTGTISGTPTAAGAVIHTITATNAGGTGTTTVAITVNAAPTLAVVDNQDYTVGTAIDTLTLPPAADGTDPLTYTLTGPTGGTLPAGLSFNAGSRELTGTPTTAATTILTYTATDTNGATATQTFTVTVELTPPIISVSVTSLTATAGTAITPVTTTSTGGPVPAGGYSVAPAVENGLSFSFVDHDISGTPIAAADVVSYTITAVNAAGSGSATVAITVHPRAPIISASVSSLTATVGNPIDVTIASTGGAVASYAISPAAGNGLAFDTDTGAISGMPTAAADEVTYTITATNVADTATATVAITVHPRTPIISASVSSLTATAGTAITPVTITTSTGGGVVASYAISPDAGNGLAFDTDTGTISGTPTVAAGAVNYRITATNVAGMATVTVPITVNAAPALTAPADQDYTAGTAITALTLPAASGGTTPFTYTLTGPTGGTLPAGLSFNAGSRQLSGTPTAAETTTLTYTATDTNGATAPQTFTVTVNAAPGLTAVANPQPYRVGMAITALTLPAATGGTGTLTYTLTGSLNGLTFDSGTRILSGMPTEMAAATTLTYTATDTRGATATQTFMVTVNPPLPMISTSVPSLIATAGIAIPDVTIISTGGAVASYAILPAAGNGLAFDTGSGTLSGTPTMAAGAVTYTITATNAQGSDTATVAITVNAALVAPIISASVSSLMATAGEAITVTIASSGGAVASYGISPSAGNGLTFDSGSATLSGTPTSAAVARTYTITATNAEGSGTTTVAITVNAAPTLPGLTAQYYTGGTAIAALTLPAASGGTDPFTYTLTGNLNGLTFDSGTRVLSGTPTAVAAATSTTLHYTATDANGGVDAATMSIIVNVAPTLTAPADQGYTAGTAITPLTLSAASGGTGTLTYTLTGPNGGTLPAGLTFNAGSRQLTGTPTAAATTTLTYTATDTNGATAPQTFTVTVNAAPVLTAPADQTYTAGTAITALTLSAVTGGTGTLTYTLTGPNAGPLPAGLTFDAGTRVLSGTPTVAAVTTLTYTATDDSGASASQTFDVTVLLAPSISASSDTVTVTVGTPITPVTIISSGGAVASYAIAPAIVNGLEFDTVTGTISGTPTAVAAAVTYTITATNAQGSDTTTVAITVSAAPNMPATGVPTITGDPTTGSVLTADISEISDANGMPTTFTYQWLADDVNIAAAATASTFTLTEAQDEDGTEITVKVSFTDDDGYPEELVSAPLRVTNITVQDTVDTTNRFLGARTDLILANLPQASRRITRLQRGAGPEQLVAVQDLTGALAAITPFDFDFFSLGSGAYTVATSLDQVTRASDSLQAQTGSLNTAEHTRRKFDVWFEGSLHDFSGSGDSGGTFGIAHLGADYLFSPDLLIGAQVQYDSLSESSSSENYKIEGQGWMVGPYATVRLFDNLLYLDGQVAWGMSDNEISPARTYTDDFTTERWLADISLTGNFTQGNWRIRPNISLSYLEETQESYVSGLSTVIPEQTVSRGHLSLGPTVSTRVSGPYGMVLEPSLNLDAIYSYAETRGVTPTGNPAGDGWRARAAPGLTITTPEGLRLGITGTYDGIGQSDFEAWSIGVKGGFRF